MTLPVLLISSQQFDEINSTPDGGIRLSNMRQWSHLGLKRNMMDGTTLVAIIPLVILQLGLQIYALWDMYKRGGAKDDNTILWVIIIIFGLMLGSIAYFIFGRKE